METIDLTIKEIKDAAGRLARLGEERMPFPLSVKLGRNKKHLDEAMEDFTQWQRKELSNPSNNYVYLDGKGNPKPRPLLREVTGQTKEDLERATALLKKYQIEINLNMADVLWKEGQSMEFNRFIQDYEITHKVPIEIIKIKVSEFKVLEGKVDDIQKEDMNVRPNDLADILFMIDFEEEIPLPNEKEEKKKKK